MLLSGTAVAVGGIVLFVIIVFQVLTGKRWIRLKGRWHLRSHRWSGYALLVFGVFHSVMGIARVFGWGLV